MLTHEEFTDFVEQIERFDGALFTLAARHLDAGEDQAAGLVLTLKARVVLVRRLWEATVTPATGWGAVATPTAPPPEPAPVKCRHTFVTGPDGATLACDKCGALKKANGRPRNPPASAPVLPGVAK